MLRLKPNTFEVPGCLIYLNELQQPCGCRPSIVQLDTTTIGRPRRRLPHLQRALGKAQERSKKDQINWAAKYVVVVVAIGEKLVDV